MPPDNRGAIDPMPSYQDERNFERYFEELRKWCTPEELGMLLELLGRPKDAAEFHAAILRLVKRQERFEWLWQVVKMAGGIFVAVGAAVILLRDLLPIVLRALTGAGP